MNFFFATIGLMAMSGSPMAKTDYKAECDANCKSTFELMHEMSETLQTVKDKAGAERALPKLTDLNRRLADLKKKEIRFAPGDDTELFNKHKKSFDSAIGDYSKEAHRLKGIPEAEKTLIAELGQFAKTLETMQMTKQAWKWLAKAQIGRIDQAIQAYKLKMGKLPSSLDELAQGDKAYLSQKDLSDPWGRLFCYNSDGPLNRGSKPDVWTDDSDGDRIGNWEEMK